MEYVIAILLLVILIYIARIEMYVSALDENTRRIQILLKETQEEVATFRLIVKNKIEKDENSIHRAYEP